MGWRGLLARLMAREALGWHISIGAVPDPRAAMAVAAVELAMVQAADGATEPVREVCHGQESRGEEREGDPPHPPYPSTIQPRTASSPPSLSTQLARGGKGTGKELVAGTLATGARLGQRGLGHWRLRQ